MDELGKLKLKEKISEILEKYLFEMNDRVTRKEIGYEIKTFMENEKMDWMTLNLHTPAEKIEKGFIDICVDGEYYPFGSNSSL